MTISRAARFDAYTRTLREANQSSFVDALEFVGRGTYRLLNVDVFEEHGWSTQAQRSRAQWRAGGLIKLMSRLFGEPEGVENPPEICDPCVGKLDDELVAGLWSGTRITTIRDGVPFNLTAEQFLVSWHVG